MPCPGRTQQPPKPGLGGSPTKQVSVLTFDTNPPPVFGRCGATAETLTLERKLKAKG